MLPCWVQLLGIWTCCLYAFPSLSSSIVFRPPTPPPPPALLLRLLPASLLHTELFLRLLFPDTGATVDRRFKPLESPKSPILQVIALSTSTFRAAKSRCTKKDVKCAIPRAVSSSMRFLSAHVNAGNPYPPLLAEAPNELEVKVLGERALPHCACCAWTIPSSSVCCISSSTNALRLSELENLLDRCTTAGSPPACGTFGTAANPSVLGRAGDDGVVVSNSSSSFRLPFAVAGR